MAEESNKARRADVRKSLPRQGLPLRQFLAQRSVWMGLLLAVGFWAIASMVVVEARNEPAFRKGQFVDQPMFTRVELEWLDQARTEELRKLQLGQVPIHYVLNQAFFDQFKQVLRSLPEIVKDLNSSNDVIDELKPFNLSDRTISELKLDLIEGKPSARWETLVDTFFKDFKDVVILNTEDYQREKAHPAWKVKLLFPDNRPREVSKELWVINLEDRKRIGKEINAIVGQFRPSMQQRLSEYILNTAEPTYLKDSKATKLARDTITGKIKPVSKTYAANEELSIKVGQPLNQDGYTLLQLEQEKYVASLNRVDLAMHYSGPVGVTLLLTIAMVGSVVAFRPRIAKNPWRGTALIGLLLSSLLIAWFVRSLGEYVTEAGVIGAALLTAVILSLAYDRLFALSISLLLVMMIGLTLNLSIGAITATMAGCVVAVVQLRDVRKRGKLIRVGFTVGLIVAVSVWIAGMTERNIYQGIYLVLAKESLYAFTSCLFTVGFFILGILPLIEKLFRVTTSMTLLELSDVNQPLLKQLAQLAPGTYNHSLAVATISESAAESINANGLLCRVAAYYHDIGKMNKPQYFVENQSGGPSRHEKLSPAMSLLIIVGHVKDGMEMAREYRLPKVLHHFIESHHGTTLVEYFYHTAKQRSEADSDTAQPSEFEFRYPGPKPHTKEAAILMLADSVEAACRAMNDPTAPRIEQLVHNIAMKKLMDEQFSQCNLTLHELELIETALTKSLCGVYHGRIAYPSDRKEEQPRIEEQEKPIAAG